MTTKHKWTEEEKEIVRRDYRGNRESCEHIAGRIGVTTQAVKSQVQLLGLAQVRHCRWTEKEDEQLRELAEELPPQKIARRMKRSKNAVVLRMKRLRISQRDHSGWYTKREVTEIFGVDHKWVQVRIDNGSLEASYHHGHRPQQNGSCCWHICEKAVRDFLVNHAWELNGRNVDLLSIVDILTSK